MIELLILFELSRKVLTMYGISKEIKSDFSPLTNPSFGTIKPALTRLTDAGFLKVQKTISRGGRPSCCYSITSEGKNELKKLISALPLNNPIHFLPMARIKLACADILSLDEQLQLLSDLKFKAEDILADITNILNSKELSFYPKMTYDNLMLEYNNFITLLEGLKNACTR